MSINANWQISGVNFDSSADAFIKSAQYAINTSNLKQHESYLNSVFKENIDVNIRRAGIEADNLSEAFSLTIGNGINFINTEPLVTQRYEYGYYDGSKDTNEEYYEEYMIQTSPRYYIRPAIQETLIQVGRVMLEDAKKEYTSLRTNREEFL